MRDVFVSYSSRDRDRAKPLEAALESCDLSVWWDRELEVGESYDVKIERELEDSRAVVVLWSKASVRSNWVKAEAQEAMGRGCLLPAILDAGIKPPLEFRFLNAVDLSAWDGTLEHSEFARLVEAIRSKLEAARGSGEEENDGPGEPFSTTVKERLRELIEGSQKGEGEPEVTESAIRRLGAGARDLIGRIARRQETEDRREKRRPEPAPPVPAPPDPLAGVDPVPTLARYLAWSFSVPAALLLALQLAHRFLG